MVGTRDSLCEQLLVIAAGAVLVTFRERIDDQQLPLSSIAALRLLESALEPYGMDLPPLQ